MKPFILLLLLPSLVWAQNDAPVNPVISKEYIDLVRKDLATEKNVFVTDSTNSFRNSNILLQKVFSGQTPIRKIKITTNSIRIYNNAARYIRLGGDFNSAIEIKTANRQPALQDEYVQGRSQNGALVWRGPETDEWFSFGSAIHSMEFDGSVYAYDIHGRLVASGTGNGIKASVYDNSILRTAVVNSQSLSLRGGLYEHDKKSWIFNLKGGLSNEQTFIENNRNGSGSFSVLIGKIFRGIEMSGNYSYLRDKFSNSNRNGFLNRVYEYSLLTPISFFNRQSSTLNNGNERRYSSVADNPFFLLENSGNYFTQTQQSGGITIEKSNRRLRFKIIQALEGFKENGSEAFKNGSAYFLNGIYTDRSKKDLSYFLKANAWTYFNYNSYRFSSTLSSNYIFSADRSRILYGIGQVSYQYKRASHDYSVSYLTTYSGRFYTGGINVGNKLYVSNTAKRNNFFLPTAGAYIRFDNIVDHISIKLSSSFNRFNSELPIDRSLAHVNLLRFAAQDAGYYFPLKEVMSYKGLMPVAHREWSAIMEVSYKAKIWLTGELFRKVTMQDVFPVYKNGNWVLKNIADHSKSGFELQLNTYELKGSSNKFSVSNFLTFTTWKSKVTHVEDGYNFTPIAGFSNINKVIAVGVSFGAIAGSSYVRNGKNEVVIGADGFPLINNRPKIIGNPIPDFIIKQGNTFTYKYLSLSINLEWRKGGDVWNGTQAALDYYGRSLNSALHRNTTNYIFPGVLEDGHANTIPVNFYDPNLPVTQNRWTRYGLTGIAEEYIQKGDNLKFSYLALSYKFRFKKYIQQLAIAAYINDLLIWSAYKGSDPGQLLYDQSNTEGLDYFNLPSTKTFGLNLSIQF